MFMALARALRMRIKRDKCEAEIRASSLSVYC